ncbi:F0F1 ATP synthase subunit epsilon [Weissella tructae]|uniref:ATP synthase epsilon chain n=2 Tax=Weissella TaxID=46255 RepID=A0A075U1L6_9LACO|nr:MULTISPECIES: F0F1 ATP synthase subunit epsilon [Weissella]AIG66068.1 ATP synthase epsilon chain [Weissella tructae]AIM63447.1 ATP synthase epsilon chain [Weissella ceti]AIM64782.1 ATP synthase epsilon chain [Weissella ceti]ELA07440.1 F0F1 ATP synthase subunit epsilon [Weissella ceti NC36]QVV91219.1 F0F1 ATP synthase subunit epsilon [Weissella tructae]
MLEKHTFAVDVVTPDGDVFTHADATMVVLHTVSGETGVMANHTPFISALRISEVKIENQTEGFEKLIAVNGGFAEFSNNLLTIVADAAERADTIDVARATAARERAERHLREAQNKRESERAEAALSRAVNRIHAATGK